MTGAEASAILLNAYSNTVVKGGRNCGKTALRTAIMIAVDAANKQTPKRPDLEGDGMDDNGNIVMDTWICPCCNRYYELDYEEHKYCPNCGQAIDWRVLE